MDNCVTLSQEIVNLLKERLNKDCHIVSIGYNLENEIANLLLKKNISFNNKCHNNGIVIKPDGVNELDPCIYKVKECYKNVSIEVLECKNCHNVIIQWKTQNDTEIITDEEFENTIGRI